MNNLLKMFCCVLTGRFISTQQLVASCHFSHCIMDISSVGDKWGSPWWCFSDNKCSQKMCCAVCTWKGEVLRSKTLIAFPHPSPEPWGEICQKSFKSGRWVLRLTGVHWFVSLQSDHAVVCFFLLHTLYVLTKYSHMWAEQPDEGSSHSVPSWVKSVARTPCAPGNSSSALSQVHWSE